MKDATASTAARPLTNRTYVPKLPVAPRTLDRVSYACAHGKCGQCAMRACACQKCDHL